MTTAGDVIASRTFELDDEGRYVPGQVEVRILDPRPHRDRADLAAVLSYVEDGYAVVATCLRYRGERGWKSIKVHRATEKRIERGRVAATLGHELDGEQLAELERAATGHNGYPFEEPSEEERRIRHVAHRLLDKLDGEGV